LFAVTKSKVDHNEVLKLSLQLSQFLWQLLSYL